MYIGSNRGSNTCHGFSTIEFHSSSVRGRNHSAPNTISPSHEFDELPRLPIEKYVLESPVSSVPGVAGVASTAMSYGVELTLQIDSFDAGS